MTKTREQMAALGWCDDCQRQSVCKECGNCDCDGHPCRHQSTTIESKGRTLIKPTGTCFDDAIDFLQAAVSEHPTWALNHLRLVHGICLSPRDALPPDVPFSHGWVEQDREIVIQAGIIGGVTGFYGLPRRHHYAIMRVQCITVYTVEEAWERNRIHRHFGPWESSYRDLCGRGKTLWRYDYDHQ